MKPFELVFMRGPFGDETSLYNIEIPRPITVEEFVDYVLEHKKDEWGDISVGNSRMEYRYGKITSGHLPLKQIVSGGTAIGGWTFMSYTLR